MEEPVPEWLVPLWRDFFTTEYLRPPGRLVYPEIYDHPTLFPLQRKREAAAMLELAQAIKPRVVMEIGTDKGGSFYHWCKIPTVTTAIGIEIRGLPWASVFGQGFPDIDFVWSLQSSYAHDTVRAIRRLLPTGALIDVLFLDGDKANFHTDFYAYYPLVRPGGLIFMHDVNPDSPDPGPPAVYQMLSETHPSTMILDTTEYDAVAVREAAGVPPATAYEGWLRHWKRTSCGVGVFTR